MDHSLQTGETAMLQARQHPVVYLRAAIWAAVAIALAIVALLGADYRLWGLASLLFAGGAAMAALEAAFRRKTVLLTVTDRRVLLTSGAFRRRFAEAFPAALAGFEMSQGPLGRAFGYARMRIPGLGEPGAWLHLPEPERVRSSIEALALRGPGASKSKTAAEPAPAPSPARAAEQEAAQPPRRKPNGDARPKPDGTLRPQPALDRF